MRAAPRVRMPDDMKLVELAVKIGASILTGGQGADVEVQHVYAGDRISDLLDQAGSNTLLVTNLSSAQLIDLAELMDSPGLCLVNNCQVGRDALDAAARRGTVIVLSPVGIYETCGRMYQVLNHSGE